MVYGRMIIKFFNDMYEKLKYRDIKAITKMYDRLNETMLLAFKISKNYYFAFLFFCSINIFSSKFCPPQFTLIGFTFNEFILHL